MISKDLPTIIIGNFGNLIGRKYGTLYIFDTRHIIASISGLVHFFRSTTREFEKIEWQWQCEREIQPVGKTFISRVLCVVHLEIVIASKKNPISSGSEGGRFTKATM